MNNGAVQNLMSDTMSSSKGTSYYGHDVIHLNLLRTRKRGCTPLKSIVSKIQALDNGAVQKLIEDSRDTSKEAIYYGYNLANATLGRSSTFAYGDIKQLKLPCLKELGIGGPRYISRSNTAGQMTSLFSRHATERKSNS